MFRVGPGWGPLLWVIANNIANVCGRRNQHFGERVLSLQNKTEWLRDLLIFFCGII